MNFVFFLITLFSRFHHHGTDVYAFALRGVHIFRFPFSLRVDKLFFSSSNLIKTHTTHRFREMTSLNLDFSVLDRPVRKEADELTST